MGKGAWTWLGLLLAVALVGCRGGDDTLKDVDIKLVLSPEPQCIGPATVLVDLIDLDGQPVTGAVMTVEGNMSHAGMVPILAEVSEPAPGRYEAPLEFTMGGDWFISVQAKLPDGRTLEHQVDVPSVAVFCGTPAP